MGCTLNNHFILPKENIFVSIDFYLKIRIIDLLTTLLADKKATALPLSFKTEKTLLLNIQSNVDTLLRVGYLSNRSS